MEGIVYPQNGPVREVPQWAKDRKVFWKTQDQLVNEGLLKYDNMSFEWGNLGMGWQLKNSSWFSNLPDFFGKRVHPCLDDVNPFTYYATKVFRPGMTNVSFFYLEHHPEFFIVL